MNRRPHRLVAALLAVPALALGLAGCGDDSPKAQSTPTASTSSGPVVDVKITDSGVSPEAKQVTVKVGQPVTLHIDATKAGELHVHSSPEQHVEFPAGTSTRTITVNQPGLVDVEDHDLDALVVRLEVR